MTIDLVAVDLIREFILIMSLSKYRGGGLKDVGNSIMGRPLRGFSTLLLILNTSMRRMPVSD